MVLSVFFGLMGCCIGFLEFDRGFLGFYSCFFL